MPAARNFVGFEAWIDGEAENEWVTGRQAALHIGEVLIHRLISQSLVLDCIGVALRVRLDRRLGACSKRPVGLRGRSVVGPLGFRTVALAGDTFDAVADIGSRIGADGPLHAALM